MMVEFDAFISSWSLFAESYLVGVFSAALLALLGAWVVGRRQIFLGAAIAQASGLGVAIALGLQLALEECRLPLPFLLHHDPFSLQTHLFAFQSKKAYYY